MRIVLGTLEFGAIGGAGTYLLTVAGQLQLLGHDVTVYAEEVGALAREAEDRGVRVAHGERALPDACDALYAQDAASAYLLAERYPDRPQAFCMHAGGSEFTRWVPPQLEGVVGAVIVLHDRLAQQAAALAHHGEIVRLRQPVDLTRFAPRAAIRERPRRALLLGNHLEGSRRDLVLRACAEAGLEPAELGRYAERSSLAPEREINEADVVIGEGRAIVEAMACGRAAFVYGQLGGDGWVTPQSYSGMESVNFAAVTGENGLVAPESLPERLREYRQSMGTANRDLARLHHTASRHAEEIVGVLERLAPAQPEADAPLRELARMARVQWHTESRALGAIHEARLLSSRLQDAEARAESAETALDDLRSARWYRLLRALARPFRRGDE